MPTNNDTSPLVTVFMRDGLEALVKYLDDNYEPIKDRVRKFFEQARLYFSYGAKGLSQCSDYIKEAALAIFLGEVARNEEQLNFNVVLVTKFKQKFMQLTDLCALEQLLIKGGAKKNHSTQEAKPFENYLWEMFLSGSDFCTNEERKQVINCILNLDIISEELKVNILKHEFLLTVNAKELTFSHSIKLRYYTLPNFMRNPFFLITPVAWIVMPLALLVIKIDWVKVAKLNIDLFLCKSKNADGKSVIMNELFKIDDIDQPVAECSFTQAPKNTDDKDKKSVRFSDTKSDEERENRRKVFAEFLAGRKGKESKHDSSSVISTLWWDNGNFFKQVKDSTPEPFVVQKNP